MSGFSRAPTIPAIGLLTPAITPATASQLLTPPWAGLLSTGGNVLFGSTNEGHSYALNATDGKLLWKFQTGGLARGNPMSYLFNGKQQVAMAMGNAIWVFGME